MSKGVIRNVEMGAGLQRYMPQGIRNRPKSWTPSKMEGITFPKRSLMRL